MLFAILIVRTKNVFRVICSEFTGPNCPVIDLKYISLFKAYKSEYGIEQLDNGF
jgi:hypothetical protein